MTDRDVERREGFTLVELVVVISMIGLLIGALSAAAITFIRSSGSLQGKLEASQSAQLTARYLPSDFQSVSPGGATIGVSPPVCGVTPNVLLLTWTDLSVTPSVRYDAIYSTVGTDLERTLCIDGVIDRTHDVAHGVASATATPIGADAIEISITTVATDADPSGFTYTVIGQRRS